MKNEFGNSNSKDIWDNSLLCAQFLRGYSNVPLLENVQPEDIEDITEELRPFVGLEYEGDAVKKIHLHREGGQETSVFVVALLEHKSKVDYDAAFQLLKYMVGIWNIYRNKRNSLRKGNSSLKGFRYPLIIPIVYYEGTDNWTAAMYWKDRVEFSGMFGEYVPDFTYRLINLHGYTNEELLSAEEELSLVMMFNRIQTVEDLDIKNWPPELGEKAQRIIQKAPEAVLNILCQMLYHFGLKLRVQDTELREFIDQVRKRDMGELWANMEKMDIQEERRKREEAHRKLDEVRQEADEARKKADEACRERDAAQESLQAAEDTIARLQAEIARLKNDKIHS